MCLRFRRQRDGHAQGQAFPILATHPGVELGIKGDKLQGVFRCHGYALCELIPMLVASA
jgi:hypothetical protein